MAETTFFNMWQASSREDQEALITEMQIEAPGLAVKDGFVSLAVWESEKLSILSFLFADHPGAISRDVGDRDAECDDLCA